MGRYSRDRRSPPGFRERRREGSRGRVRESSRDRRREDSRDRRRRVPETGEETTRGKERPMTRDIGGGKTPGRGKTRETSIGMNLNLKNLENNLWGRVRREWRRIMIRSLV